jgi:hypothetical protein
MIWYMQLTWTVLIFHYIYIIKLKLNDVFFLFKLMHIINVKTILSKGDNSELHGAMFLFLFANVLFTQVHSLNIIIIKLDFTGFF